MGERGQRGGGVTRTEAMAAEEWSGSPDSPSAAAGSAVSASGALLSSVSAAYRLADSPLGACCALACFWGEPTMLDIRGRCFILNNAHATTEYSRWLLLARRP